MAPLSQEDNGWLTHYMKHVLYSGMANFQHTASSARFVNTHEMGNTIPLSIALCCHLIRQKGLCTIERTAYDGGDCVLWKEMCKLKGLYEAV